MSGKIDERNVKHRNESLRKTRKKETENIGNVVGNEIPGISLKEREERD